MLPLIILLFAIPLTSAEGETCEDDTDCACTDICYSPDTMQPEGCRTVTAPNCDFAGDADNDNEVTCVDLWCALHLTVGLPPDPACTDTQCLDVVPLFSGDGNINIGDVVQLTRLAARNGYDCGDDPGSADPPGQPSNPRQCSIPRPQCRDGEDNDGDGRIDHRIYGNPRTIDWGCAIPNDNDEHDPFVHCDDGADNDGDTLIDWRADGTGDPGCAHMRDTSETTPGCNDGADNDGDSKIDLNDPGCVGGLDEFETDQFTACDDGVDNDVPPDGRIDWRPDPTVSDYGCTDLEDDSEANPECNDASDNDNDGLNNHPVDTGCESLDDPSEREQCQDGYDNDGDELADYNPLPGTHRDPGCLNPTDNEQGANACDDGADNDGDGTVDMEDYGCQSAADTSEDNPECSDGIDNADPDTLIDYGEDPECATPRDISESDQTIACQNTVDDDGDGLIDLADPGCESSEDHTEETACEDGLDNDGDGLWDYVAPGNPSPVYGRTPRTHRDPGCDSLTDNSEKSKHIVCDDGRDNDIPPDGQTDYPRDVGCSHPADDDEANPDCANGADDDGDGDTDYPMDPGCSRADDADELGWRQCDNGVDDNDAEDTAVDGADTGCRDSEDNDEKNYACNDGLDNDGDGLKDREDEGCLHDWWPNQDDNSEQTWKHCDDGIDNDGDGVVDWNLNAAIGDPGCWGQSDRNERGGAPQYLCDDYIDNDNDGLENYPNDPGCSSPWDTSPSDGTRNPEDGNTQCDDGIDNDNDGKVDYQTGSFSRDPGCDGPTDTTEFGGGSTECNDGVNNNDGDTVVDYPNDPGCSSLSDPSERTWYQCDDGFDNEQLFFGGPLGDGLIDAADPGCRDLTTGLYSPFDGSEMLGTSCDDGADNDWDGYRDLQDSGCPNVFDWSEHRTNGVDPECSDTFDNDGDGAEDLADEDCENAWDDDEEGLNECANLEDDDGDFLVDYGQDPGCADKDDPSELADLNVQCDNGIDDDGDTKTDWGSLPWRDWGCSLPWDPDELNNNLPVVECDNGINDDYDGLTDYPEDPGCEDERDLTETSTAQCDNGVDDGDADTKIDWPRDPGCVNAEDLDEDDGSQPSCSDGIENQDETDTDCGGLICGKCTDGLQCGSGPNADANCQSDLCFNGVCYSCADGSGLAKSGGPMDCNHCKDGIQTPGTDEIDVDCGGADCKYMCKLGQRCNGDPDCRNGHCLPDAAGVNRCTEAEDCNNGFRDFLESDLDCGGPNCKPCRRGEGCVLDRNCVSSLCITTRSPKVCAGPTSCADSVGVPNNGESDVNCGGPQCKGCAQGKRCNTNADCKYNLCVPNAGGPGVNLCSNCMPLYPNAPTHQNDPDADRINVLIYGVGYQAGREQDFIRTARDAVDIPHKNAIGKSLAELEVYKDKLNNFNFWYVPYIAAPVSDVSRCTQATCACRDACMAQTTPTLVGPKPSDPSDPKAFCNYLPDFHNIRLCNWICQPSTYVIDPPPSELSLDIWRAIAGSYVESGYNLPDTIYTVVHEFQHNLADLADEYISTNIPIDARNCAPDQPTAETWWGDLAGQTKEGLTVGYYPGCGISSVHLKPTQSSLMDGQPHRDLIDPTTGQPVGRATDYRLGLVNERLIQQRIDYCVTPGITCYPGD